MCPGPSFYISLHLTLKTHRLIEHTGHIQNMSSTDSNLNSQAISTVTSEPHVNDTTSQAPSHETSVAGTHQGSNIHPHLDFNMVKMWFLTKKQDEHLDHLAVYLNNVEARDKICRAIQYGSKFISGGADGVAHQVDSSTSLARKVFRLLKSVNELQHLREISDKHKGVRLGIITSQHTLMGVYFALDNLVWAGRVGIYKNKRHIDFLQNLSLYFFLAGSAACASSELFEVASLIRRKTQASEEKQGASKEDNKKKMLANALGLARSSLDVAVAFGLLKLAPRTVTPRMTGAFGFISSLITCYQIFVPTDSKVKTS